MDTFYVGRVVKNKETGKFVGTVVWVSRYSPQSPAATAIRPQYPIRIVNQIPVVNPAFNDRNMSSERNNKNNQTFPKQPSTKIEAEPSTREKVGSPKTEPMAGTFSLGSKTSPTKATGLRPPIKLTTKTIHWILSNFRQTPDKCFLYIGSAYLRPHTTFWTLQNYLPSHS